jgi:molybdopterin converting factor subunit 1
MKITVQLFARARDLAGSDAVTVELPAMATVAEIRQVLSKRYPSLARLIERSALAVNSEFADDSLMLQADAEVALLPPVSGG